MGMTVWSTYLDEKKKNKQKIKVYLKSQTYGKDKQKINSIMLTGFVDSFDEETLRLSQQECIIERHDIISIKPDTGLDRD